jgi:prevent-host-death family protein
VISHGKGCPLLSEKGSGGCFFFKTREALLTKQRMRDTIKSTGRDTMIIATATEMQNNFGRYLNLVMSGQEIIVTKNGREVGRFIPKDSTVSYLTDSLTGILNSNDALDEARTERLKEKYEVVD